MAHPQALPWLLQGDGQLVQSEACAVAPAAAEDDQPCHQEAAGSQAAAAGRLAVVAVGRLAVVAAGRLAVVAAGIAAAAAGMPEVVAGMLVASAEMAQHLQSQVFARPTPVVAGPSSHETCLVTDPLLVL